MDHPYRVPEPPRPRRTIVKPGLLELAVTLLLLHAATLAVVAILGPLLRWTGPNGVAGYAIRIAVTLVGAMLAWALVTGAIDRMPTRRALVTAAVLPALYLALTFLIARATAPIFFIPPRGGVTTVDDLSFVKLAAAAFANPAIVFIIAPLLQLGALRRRRRLEDARKILVDTSPCLRCGEKGRTSLDGPELVCDGCGWRSAAPSDDELAKYVA